MEELNGFAFVMGSICLYLTIKEIMNNIKIKKEIELRHKQIFEKELNRVKKTQMAKDEEVKPAKNKKLYEALEKNIL